MRRCRTLVVNWRAVPRSNEISRSRSSVWQGGEASEGIAGTGEGVRLGYATTHTANWLLPGRGCHRESQDFADRFEAVDGRVSARLWDPGTWSAPHAR